MTRRKGVGLGTGTVCRLGQHGFAGLEMGIERTVRQTRLFHDVGNPRSGITTAPDGARSRLHDALVGRFFGGGADVGLRFSHDVHHT